jgi:hypothetical protein
MILHLRSNRRDTTLYKLDDRCKPQIDEIGHLSGKKVSYAFYIGIVSELQPTANDS